MSNAQEQKLLKAFGRGLAAVRKSKGLTQRQLAEKVDMSVVTIAYLETGERWAKITTLEKLAKNLGVRIADLFGEL